MKDQILKGLLTAGIIIAALQINGRLLNPAIDKALAPPVA